MRKKYSVITKDWDRSESVIYRSSSFSRCTKFVKKNGIVNYGIIPDDKHWKNIGKLKMNSESIKRSMQIEAEMLKGNINRIIITEEIEEAELMAKVAKERIDALLTDKKELMSCPQMKH